MVLSLDKGHAQGRVFWLCSVKLLRPHPWPCLWRPDQVPTFTFKIASRATFLQSSSSLWPSMFYFGLSSTQRTLSLGSCGRFTRYPPLILVGALCSKQQDLGDNSHAVSTVRDIYNSARYFIWLDTSDLTTGLVISTTHELEHFVRSGDAAESALNRLGRQSVVIVVGRLTTGKISADCCRGNGAKGSGCAGPPFESVQFQWPTRSIPWSRSQSSTRGVIATTMGFKFTLPSLETGQEPRACTLVAKLDNAGFRPHPESLPRLDSEPEIP